MSHFSDLKLFRTSLPVNIRGFMESYIICHLDFVLCLWDIVCQEISSNKFEHWSISWYENAMFTYYGLVPRHKSIIARCCFSAAPGCNELNWCHVLHLRDMWKWRSVCDYANKLFWENQASSHFLRFPKQRPGYVSKTA